LADFPGVAIVGRGLIGGSIELAVRERCGGVRVVALDRGDGLGAVRGADLVVLAAPILEIVQLLPQLRAHVSSETVVTDTGSTKASIVAAAGGMRFIGGHPVAGAATSGAAAARPDLFVGHPWILTPSETARPEDVARVRAFVERLGATVHLMTADAHDRLFAFISHLPQLVVSALMHAAGSHAGEAGLALAGPGLRDSTRLAASPPDIWRDVLQTNHQHVADAIDSMIDVLSTLRDDTSGDAVGATFASAARWKRALGERSI
jgi:prephenate dehydrogenase